MSAGAVVLSLMGFIAGAYLVAWYVGRKEVAKLKASWEKPTVPAPKAPEPPAGTEAK